MKHETILIIDFGSQYTQLIARRLRAMNVYCEVHPYQKNLDMGDKNIKGVILSGGPASVKDDNAPNILEAYKITDYPVLGICYGAQWIVDAAGGTVERSTHRQYGISEITRSVEMGMNSKPSSPPLLHGTNYPAFNALMSHGDSITELPPYFGVDAMSGSAIAAFSHNTLPIYGLQFHPEVNDTEHGARILATFVVGICGCKQDWTPDNFIDETIKSIKSTVGDGNVVLALSGGVDSTVAAILLQIALGDGLHCVFVDTGLLRKDEYEGTLKMYKTMGLNVHGVDADLRFRMALMGISGPEEKRKMIGNVFINIFTEYTKSIVNEYEVEWLAQGTIYPDVIESAGSSESSVNIKSHHNVGGLPADMELKLIEPLRLLFKDEVREIGRHLGIHADILGRHPFPGPGLAIRVLGNITSDKLDILREADSIYINILREEGLYDKIWQAGAILLPVKSVGVMGDERTYEYVIALRAVSSQDGMTADWYPMPHDVLAKISNTIINRVKGVNRVVYDISSKPPATIEWE